MATKRQDVELGIAASVSNAERIAQLGTELQNLARQGGAAAPEFRQLADELGKLGKQQAAVDNLNKIESELAATSGSLEKARESARQFGDAFERQAASTQDFREKQQQAKQALDTTRAALIDAKLELEQLRNSTDRAGKSSDEYKARQRELKDSISQLEATAAKQHMALKQANAELRASESALNSAASASNKAQKEVGRLTEEYNQQSQALSAAAAAMAKSGVNAQTSAQAQETLSKSLNDVIGSTTTLTERQRQLAEIEAHVAASNARNVDLAKQAAAARVTAAAQARAAAEAQALAENRLAYALEEVAAAEAQAAREAKEAGEALNKAFSTTGTRSIAAIRADIDEVRQSLALLQSQGVSKFELDKALAGANLRLKELRQELASVPGQFNIINAGVDLLKNQFVQLAAAYQGIDLAQKFIDANVQIEALRRALTVTTGSVTQADRQIGFLRDTANRTGQSFGELTDEYKKFSVALQTSGYSAQQTDAIFQALASAAGKLGLSSDATGRALNALGQMASKGVVSMEELRGQLGDALPGAMQIAANAVGIPQERLIKLIETGNVLAKDLLPFLPEAFAKAFGPADQQVQGFQASWNRLKNAITETVTSATGSDLFKGLTAGVAFAADNFRTLTTVVIDAGKAFAAFKIFDYLTGLASVSTATRQATLDQSLNTEATVANAAAKTRSNLVEVEAATTRRLSTAAITAESAAMIANTQASVANATAHKATAGTVSTSLIPTFAGAATSVGSFGGALLTGVTRLTAFGIAAKFTYDIIKDGGKYIGEAAAKLAGYSDDMAKVNAALAEGDRLRKLNMEQTSATILRVQDAYVQLNKQNAEAIVIAEKEVKARQAEGEVLTMLSRQFDDATRQKQTELEVVGKNAAAIADLAQKRQVEAATLAAEVEKIIAVANATHDETDATKKLIQEKQNKAKIAAEEAARAESEAIQSQVRVTQLNAEAAATQDNSARVNELRVAYENAAQRAAIMDELRKSGVVSAEASARATSDEAAALRLYRDALADASRNLQLKIQQSQSDYNMTKANLDVRMQEARLSEQSAQLLGNERAAIEAKVQQKRIEIETVRASAEQKRAEANATIEYLQKQRDEITGTDDVSVSKRKEIDLRIQNEKAKLREADASEDVVRGIRNEIDAIQQKANAQAGSFGGNSDKYSAPGTGSQQQNDGSGPITGSYDYGALNTLKMKEKAGTLGPGDLALAQKAYEVALANYETMSKSNFMSPGSLSTYYGEMLEAKRILDMLRGMGNDSGSVGGGVSPGGLGNYSTGSPSVSTPSASTAATQAASPSVQTWRVELALGGQTTPINTASAADAQRLTNFLQTLGTTANRTV